MHKTDLKLNINCVVPACISDLQKRCALTMRPIALKALKAFVNLIIAVSFRYNLIFMLNAFKKMACSHMKTKFCKLNANMNLQ